MTAHTHALFISLKNLRTSYPQLADLPDEVGQSTSNDTRYLLELSNFVLELFLFSILALWTSWLV